MTAFLQPGRRLGSILAGMVLLSGSCLASLDDTNQFRLYTRPRVAQEGGTTTCHVLETATARYAFVAPRNWAVKEDAIKREVVLMARNLTTSIRFKMVAESPEAPPETRVARWREAALENLPEGRITEEFKCYSSRIEGTAFDLERTAANARIFTRVAFIPQPDGWVEFNMTTTSGNPLDARLAFGNFLTSFHVEPLAAK